MTSKEYSKLVDYYTEIWRRSPEKYRRKIGWYAWLGVIVLVISFALAVALIAIMHVWTVVAGLIILYSIVRAVVYRPEAVEGIPIERHHSPELFADVDAVSEQLGARKCDGIRLNFDFNAYARQFHRWGIIGPLRNYVILGIPLLDVMGRDQTRSTIAHEIGHLILRHGARSRRWYAMSEMYTSMQRHLSGGVIWYLFAPFVNWYLPRFHAMLQPNTLQSEFDADAMESRVTSPEIACESLCLLSIGSRQYYSALKEHCAEAAVTGEQSPTRLADTMYRAARDWTAEDAQSALERALRAATDVEGTHPALAERLAALGGAPIVPQPVTSSASDFYLGTARRDFAILAAQSFVENSEEYADMAALFLEPLLSRELRMR